MSKFFKPYEGRRPYLFVSYSHLQSEQVVETIRLLHEGRWRVWYDEGIPAGGDWPRNIEQHMRLSGAVLFFLSGSALASPNCFSEIKTALALGKRVMVVPLEESEIDGEWRKLLDRCTTLAARSSAKERAGEILGCGLVTGAFHRKPLEDLRWDTLGLAASAAVFLATLAALFGLMTGRITLGAACAEETPPPAETAAPSEAPEVDLGPWESLFPVEFPDEQQARAVLAALGRSGGDVLWSELPQVRALYFCGNMTLKGLEAVEFSDAGEPTVNGARVIEGKVADLGVIGRMPLLEELALIRQPVSELGALRELTRLRMLSLAGCDTDALATLGAQGSIETLRLEHSAVRDLSALGEMSALRTVTVSAEMLPLRWDESAGYELLLVK